MPTLIHHPAITRAAGNPPKIIAEYFGRVNSGNNEVSIAQMISPIGWSEPFQTPAFDEYTVVLKGRLLVTTVDGDLSIAAGQGVLVKKGERVQYSTPEPEGAEYISVCLPAFSPDLVNREQ